MKVKRLRGTPTSKSPRARGLPMQYSMQRMRKRAKGCGFAGNCHSEKKRKWLSRGAGEATVLVCHACFRPGTRGACVREGLAPADGSRQVRRTALLRSERTRSEVWATPWTRRSARARRLTPPLLPAKRLACFGPPKSMKRSSSPMGLCPAMKAPRWTKWSGRRGAQHSTFDDYQRTVKAQLVSEFRRVVWRGSRVRPMAGSHAKAADVVRWHTGPRARRSFGP
jgi:hypothetical protein